MPGRRIEPKPGQESVWDYPRPPSLVPSPAEVRVEFGGQVVAETRKAFRVLETSHPPVFYLPPEDVRDEFVVRSARSSFCEFKGRALYFDLLVGDRRSKDVGWFYPSPTREFAPIAGFLAFYPGRVDACFVDGERVQAQEGDFYGGWITGAIVGPFKGGPGTRGW